MSTSAIAGYSLGPHTVPIGLLVPSKTNPRKTFNQETLQELADSIAAKGVIERIVVRPHLDNFEIVAGERRYRASVLAKLEEVPVEVKDLNDLEALEIQVIENDQREDPPFLEQALGYHALIYRGATVEQLANEIGKDPKFVASRLRLAQLHEKFHKNCHSGDMSLGIALELCRLQPKDQLAVPDWALENVARLRGYIRDRVLLDLGNVCFELKDAELVPAAGSCVDCPKRTGNQKLLFPDVKKGDTCTDPQCYHAKVDAFVKANSKDLVQIVNNTAPKAGQVRMYSGQYETVKKKTPGAVAAIHVEGHDKGRVEYIKIREKGKDAAEPSYRDPGRAQLKKYKAARALHTAILKAVVASANADEDLSDLDLTEMLYAFWEAIKTEQQVVVLEAMGWDLKKSQFGRGADEKAVRAKIDGLVLDELRRFQLCMAYSGNVPVFSSMSFGEQRKALNAVAKRYNVDVAAIEKHFKDAAAQRKTRKKAVGVDAVKGICTECGCSEFVPCIRNGVPCAWGDESQTLCNYCEPKDKATPKATKKKEPKK